MFPRSIAPFFFLAALLLAIVGPSLSRPSALRATASTSALSHKQFIRRSSSPSPLRRRSFDDQFAGSDDLTPVDFLYLDNADTSNIRRSLDTDPDDQEKARAEDDWEQFVATTPDEDPDSYPDSFAEDGEVASSCSGSNESEGHDAQKTSANSGNPKHSEKVNSGAEYLTNEPSDSEAAKKKEAEDAKKKAAEAAAKKEAEAAKQQEAESLQQQQADAEKQKKDEEEKQKEADAAKAKKDADAAKQAEEAKKKQAGSSSTAPDSYKITDVKPIPGTSVTTGTAHKDHSADSYSTPSSDVYSGDATFYQPDLGACGMTNQSSEMVVAVSHLLYDSFRQDPGNPNTNDVCKKKIRATYQGRSVDVMVVDRCVGCDRYSLDFTLAAFQKLGRQEEGRLHGMTWTFLS